jgi:hypothetical protein
LLEVPRDPFFQFVTGQIDDITQAAAPPSERLTDGERELLASYRRLPRRFQLQLRERAIELQTLASARSRRTR